MSRAITVVGREGPSLQKDLAKRDYDAVIIESKLAAAADLSKLLWNRSFTNPALVGSRTDAETHRRRASRRPRPRRPKRASSRMAKDKLCVWILISNTRSGISSKACGMARGKSPPDADRRGRTAVDSSDLARDQGQPDPSRGAPWAESQYVEKKILDLDIPVKRARASWRTDD